ncbi:MAG: energy transducer TonB [Xanthomonadales bacterium]|nr:energy transducer TonB [Xanthomonadales bacterium]
MPLILIAVVLAALGAAAWWFLGRPGLAVKTAAPSAPVAASAEDPNTLAPVAVSEDLSANELYKQARSAMSDNRMVAPPGNNALEYYLRIIALQPDDANAMDALRELFPFATGSAEDQINQGNFDEASRIMGLLAKADPSNYALTILRSKLDARRRLAEREQAQQAQKEALAAAQAAAAANPQAAAAAPAAPTEEAPAPVPAPTAAPARTQVATATPAPAATPPPAPAPVGETRDARVLVPPNPTYPVAAVRNRQNGWVEVEFVVTADGAVRNARVTASDPRGVFDREALSAVQKAKFEPRLQNGQPQDSTLRRRIEFKLN